MGSVETAGGVARSWRGTGWRGARRGAPPRPDFRKMPRARAPSSVAGWPLHHHPRPRAPRFILAAGKPAAPADLLFGFVCASAAGADSPSFETSRPRRSAICSVCRGDALCRVCLQRSRAPCHVFPSPPRPPPHVKVALTSCSPHPVPGRRPRPGSEGSRSRGCGRSEPSRAGWGQPGSLAPCQGARQRLGRGQPLLSVCTGHVQILRRFVEGT